MPEASRLVEVVAVSTVTGSHREGGGASDEGFW